MLISRRKLIKAGTAAIAGAAMGTLGAYQANAAPLLSAVPDRFQPTNESLAGYQCPDWFRDGKFGIWAVWGPESHPLASRL